MRLQQKIADRFTYRHLLVKHHLTEIERTLLHPLTWGLPHPCTLREMLDEVCRLFDRHCRTEAALAKLAHRRARDQRFHLMEAAYSELFS